MANQLFSSESNEWYTPPDIIERARAAMGSINCDPASNQLAQRWIKATSWYGMGDDGLHQSWAGNVWLNPPYGQRNLSANPPNYGAGAWVNRAIALYENGEISQACILVRGDSDGVKRLRAIAASCEPFSRIAFIKPNGEKGSKPIPGCCIYYLGDRLDEFYTHFQDFGAIRVPYRR